jgi:hypothetical protein
MMRPPHWVLPEKIRPSQESTRPSRMWLVGDSPMPVAGSLVLAEAPTNSELAEIPMSSELAEIPMSSELAEIPMNSELAEIPMNSELAEIPTNSELAELAE